jgi:pyruvate dehydrogenase E1 component beta subunit
MSNVPGLKLVAPTFPADVKAFMQASIRDDDPVVFYFQRTLMGLSEEVPDVQDIPTLKNAAKVVKEGKISQL